MATLRMTDVGLWDETSCKGCVLLRTLCQARGEVPLWLSALGPRAGPSRLNKGTVVHTRPGPQLH